MVKHTRHREHTPQTSKVERARRDETIKLAELLGSLDALALNIVAGTERIKAGAR